LSIFDGVPHYTLKKETLNNDITIIDFLTDTVPVLPSKSEARRALKENSISINKTKINDSFMLSHDALINNKYILIQRGKKNYFLIIAE